MDCRFKFTNTLHYFFVRISSHMMKLRMALVRCIILLSAIISAINAKSFKLLSIRTSTNNFCENNCSWKRSSEKFNSGTYEFTICWWNEEKNIYTACYQLNTLCNTVRLGVPSEFSLNPRFVYNMRIWSKTLLHTFSTVQNTLKSIFSKKKTQLSLEVAAQTPKKYRRTFRRCEGTTIIRKNKS